MNTVEIILIAVISAAVIAAVAWMICSGRMRNGCSCGCSSCPVSDCKHRK